ncbi:MAG: hypothetical protein M3Y72_07000, partial [Acidobacteriota bacterium]|nr:hypothetical protein [Acidobacteriota bacterium]
AITVARALVPAAPGLIPALGHSPWRPHDRNEIWRNFRRSALRATPSGGRRLHDGQNDQQTPYHRALGRYGQLTLMEALGHHRSAGTRACRAGTYPGAWPFTMAAS